MPRRDAFYRNVLDQSNLQAALTGVGSFVDAFKGWDQVARQNIQLAEAQKRAERLENQYWAAMPDELQLGDAGGAGGGTRRSRSGGGVQEDIGVTLGEAVAAMQADNVAKEQAMLGAEKQLVAAQGAEVARQNTAEAKRLTDARLADIANRLGQDATVDAAAIDRAAGMHGVSGADLADLVAAGVSPDEMRYQPSSLAPVWRGAPSLPSGSPQLMAAFEALTPTPGLPDEGGVPIEPGPVTERVPGSGGRGDTGRGTWVALDEEEAVDAAAVAGGTAAVAAELGDETAEAGTLASKLMGLEATATVDEAKAEVERLGREGIVRNPIAEFSGVTAESRLPSLVELRYAVASAKDRDRTHIEDILGRKVSRSEVKELDKLMADYRAYASGLSMKADEIRRTKRDEALEKKRAEGDTFAMLVVGDLAKLKSPEDAEILADHLADMYTYDPDGARGLLTFWKGMKKDELAEEAKRLEADRAASRAASKGYRGNKQLFSEWKEHHSQWKTAEGLMNEALKKKAEAGFAPIPDEADRAEYIERVEASYERARMNSAAAHKRQEATYRLLLEDSRNTGAALPTEVKTPNSVFDSRVLPRLAKAKDKDKFWKSYQVQLATQGATEAEAKAEVDRQQARYPELVTKKGREKPDKVTKPTEESTVVATPSVDPGLMTTPEASKATWEARKTAVSEFMGTGPKARAAMKTKATLQGGVRAKNDALWSEAKEAFLAVRQHPGLRSGALAKLKKIQGEMMQLKKDNPGAWPRGSGAYTSPADYTGQTVSRFGGRKNVPGIQQYIDILERQ